MKIAIIGTGNLGLSIAKGLLINNSITTLYLTKRNPDSLKDWNKSNRVIVSQDNLKAVCNSDILIFAVQPIHMGKILNDVKHLLNENHVVISTITGFKIERIESFIGSHIPIIRSMPNTAISVGKSMTCLCSNKVGEKTIDIATAIFNGLGTSIKIAEFDSCFSIASLIPILWTTAFASSR